VLHAVLTARQRKMMRPCAPKARISLIALQIAGRFVIESRSAYETTNASSWDCGSCFDVASSLPLVQPTAVRRDPPGYARKSIPVQADKVSEIKHVYEIRPRNDGRGFDLISDALPFGRLLYLKIGDAIGYAKFRSRSCDAVIHVYDEAGKLIEMHRHKGDFKEP
jgi:hypothetical protein